MHVIIDEAVVRRVVGGPRFLRDQLRHVQRLVSSGRCDVRVIPFSAGAHMMRNSRPAGVDWRTSTFCSNSNCIQVAAIGDSIAVRDSKDPDGTVLKYSRAEWEGFLAGIGRGDFTF